jgi:hypothetical protein
MNLKGKRLENFATSQYACKPKRTFVAACQRFTMRHATCILQTEARASVPASSATTTALYT